MEPSNGSNVIPNRARPGLASLGRHKPWGDPMPYGVIPYRTTLLIRERNPLGPYRRPMPGVIGGSYRGGRFLMSEVPL